MTEPQVPLTFPIAENQVLLVHAGSSWISSASRVSIGKRVNLKQYTWLKKREVRFECYSLLRFKCHSLLNKRGGLQRAHSLHKLACAVHCHCPCIIQCTELIYPFLPCSHLVKMLDFKLNKCTMPPQTHSNQACTVLGLLGDFQDMTEFTQSPHRPHSVTQTSPIHAQNALPKLVCAVSLWSLTERVWFS